MPSSNRTVAAAMMPHAAAALGAAALCLAVAASAAAQVPVPAVTGPVPATVLPGTPSHNHPFFSTNHDIAAQGYIEQEFFLQGTASTYSTPTLATGSVIDSGHPYTD